MKKFAMHSSSLNEDPDTQPEMNLGDPNDPTVAQMEQSIMQFEAEEESFRTDMRVIYTMEALKQIARNVAGYPGRKNLIWLSGAFPLTILPDSSLPSAFGPMRQYGDQIHETASIMTDAQMAIYPVDARGLVGSFMPDASSSGRDRFGRSRNGPALATEMSRRSSALASSHDSMNELAEQTGGRAYYNRNDIDHAVALGVADGSNYYTLAYYPEDKNWDGKFRKVEVKIARKGAHARHRKGYYATDPGAAARVNEKAARGEFLNALTPEAPNATMLPFVARVTPPNKADPATLVDFSVEPRAIAFEANGSLEHAQLDFITRAFDAKGKLINNQSDTLTADLKPETYANVMKSGLRIRQKINLTPGKYLLKVGVRDTRTNLIGTISAQIEVPQS
jgi:VWFA-related protein